MKFKTRAAMESNPDFYVDANLDSIGLNFSLQGSGEATVDSVSVEVDEVPIRLAIPFLKRRRLPLFASIGGAKVRLSPFHIKAAGGPIQLEGVLGTDGISSKFNVKVKCKTNLEMDGRLAGLAGKDGTLIVKFIDEDFELD